MTDLSPETVGTTPPDDPRADEGLVEAVARAIEPGPWSLRDIGLKLDDWQQASLNMSISRARAALTAARSHGGV